MNNQDEFAATLAVELVRITLQEVNAMRAAGLVGFPDVDAIHACTLRQYRAALAAVRTGGTGDLPQPTEAAADALTCKHCGNTIDPKFCHCGQYVVDQVAALVRERLTVKTQEGAKGDDDKNQEEN